MLPVLCPQRREGATPTHRSADTQRAGSKGRGFRFLFCEKKRLNFCSRKRRLLLSSMLLANKKSGKRAKIMRFRFLRKRSIIFARNLNLPDTLFAPRYLSRLVLFFPQISKGLSSENFSQNIKNPLGSDKRTVNKKDDVTGGVLRF